MREAEDASQAEHMQSLWRGSQEVRDTQSGQQANAVDYSEIQDKNV